MQANTIDDAHDTAELAVTETERRPNRRSGLGVASVETEPPGVQHDESIAALVLDSCAFQQGTEPVGRRASSGNLASVNMDDPVERARGWRH